MTKPYERRFESKAKSSHWIGRGFTLVELMVVVIIIGVMAAIIIPTASRAMRARRSSGAASQIALAYRIAKMRALARGSAVMVRYQAGQVQTFEAPPGLTTGMTSCSTPGAWNNCAYQSTTCVPIDNYQNPGENLNYTLIVGGSQVTGVLDICFSPAGLSYLRTGSASFSTMTNVPMIKVWNGGAADMASSLVNTVYILPNGAARVVARQGS
jgi:prepilin-type N-terminal cleavage/methylation domain-containing protein